MLLCENPLPDLVITARVPNLGTDKLWCIEMYLMNNIQITYLSRKMWLKDQIQENEYLIQDKIYSRPDNY